MSRFPMTYVKLFSYTVLTFAQPMVGDSNPGTIGVLSTYAGKFITPQINMRE